MRGFDGRYPTLDVWFAVFREMAQRRGFRVGKMREYADYFDDGDAPAIALKMEIEARSKRIKPKTYSEESEGL